MPSPQTRPRKDPPRRRSFTGYDPTKLLSPDPGKKYKFVDPSAKIDGVRSHESRGWTVVLNSKDGPKLEIGGSGKSAEPVEYDGLVLMSIDREEFARIQREGQHGESGQELLDEIDRQILNPRGGGIDQIRSPLAQVMNETTAPTTFTAQEM